MKPVAFRILTPLLALLTLGLASEFSLRIAANWVQYRERAANPSLTFAPDEFRIMTIGESTTANYVVDGIDESWPEQLGRILNEAHLGRTFRVINLGKSAELSTPHLIKDVEEKLPVTKPDLVVSMMGINDNLAYDFLHEPGWFSSLRVVKLGRWIWRSCRGEGAPKLPKLSQEVARAAEGFRKDVEKKLDAGDFGGADTELAELVARYPEQRWIFYKIAGTRYMRESNQLTARVRGPVKDQAKADLALDTGFKYIRMYFELFPADPEIATRIELYGILRHKPDLARAMISWGLSKGLVLNGPALTLLPVIGGTSDPVLRREFEARGLKLSDRHTRYSNTVENYRILAKLLKDRGIGYIAMQYPTGKINPLREIFSTESLEEIGRKQNFGEAMYADVPELQVSPEYGHVLFASNENFSDVVNPAKEDEYYRDKFAAPFHRFGHTTPRGHALIAKNLEQVILANWDELKGVSPQNTNSY